MRFPNGIPRAEENLDFFPEWPLIRHANGEVSTIIDGKRVIMDHECDLTIAGKECTLDFPHHMDGSPSE